MDVKGLHTYFSACKLGGINSEEAVRTLTKYAAIKKYADFWSLAAKFGIPTLVGLLGFGGGTYIGSSHQKAIDDEKLNELKSLLDDIKHNPGISTENVMGSLAGGGIGYLSGPKLFTTLDPGNARILGSLGGALLGAAIGSAYKK